MKIFTIQTSSYVIDGNKYKKTIEKFLKANISDCTFSEKNPDCVIILGGDGTIIDTMKKFAPINPLFFGLNLGNVGFLASVRDRNNFLDGINRLIKGDYQESKRMIIEANLLRNNKIIKSVQAMNEIVIKHLLGVVHLDVIIAKESILTIKGDGVMVSTPAGSTGYNLSADGPIISPTLECFIITKMFDHNTKTPSVVLDPKNNITVRVNTFRNSRQKIQVNGKLTNVTLQADGYIAANLQEFDEIVIGKNKHLIRIAELNENYFFSSLKEKFQFK